MCTAARASKISRTGVVMSTYVPAEIFRLAQSAKPCERERVGPAPKMATDATVSSFVPFRMRNTWPSGCRTCIPGRSKACPSAARSPHALRNALCIDGIHVLDPPTHPAALVLRLVLETREGARVLPFPASPLAPRHRKFSHGPEPTAPNPVGRPAPQLVSSPACRTTQNWRPCPRH